jgi:hypothetical protein
VNDAPFVTGALSASHNRASFSCGVEPLDRYFRQQASQDVRRRIASCFVLTEAATGVIAGYYTLTAASIVTSQLPDAITAKPNFTTFSTQATDMIPARFGALSTLLPLRPPEG